jgi:hypothetical protein
MQIKGKRRINLSSVWYTGRSNVRAISDSQWAAAGVSGVADSQWDVTNGWSLPRSAFTTPQLAILDADGEFNTNAADGPRPGGFVAGTSQGNVWRGTSPPTDHNSVWIDNTDPVNPITKIYNSSTSSWISQLTALTGTLAPLLPTVGSITYNSDGTLATDENGAAYAYNSDGSVHTITKGGVTRTASYDSNGNLIGWS